MKSSAYRLQIKLVLSLFLFTVVMTVVMTSLEIFNQYHQGIKELHVALERIRDAHSSTLAQTLWRFDEHSIDIQMQSIVNEADVIGVTVTDEIKGTRQLGQTTSSGKLIRVSFPLFAEKSPNELGVTTLYATDSHFRERMIRQLPMTILSELTKIITAALFLLVCFYLLFGRHLNRIISYTDSLSLDNLDAKLQLNRPTNHEDMDELDRLMHAINNMTGRIEEYIKERTLAEQLIASKNSELEQIVYVASHDLRSPLVNVDGYSRELEFSMDEIIKVFEESQHNLDNPVVQVMLKELPDIANAIQLIRSSTRQMDKVLKGLLKLSRSGREAINVECINANNLITRVLSTFEYQLKELDISISVDPLPSCCADDTQLTQIFSNLLSNSIKYRDPSRPLSVRISGSTAKDQTTYCVEDNGIGIAPEHQEKIFELFHRLNPSSDDGDGLGLTIIKQSLLRMNGSIRVESGQGEGCRFYVTLPTVVQKSCNSSGL